MKFVQIVEYETSKADELAALMQQDTPDMGAVNRAIVTRDRDNPQRYLVIVEFESYEEAMANSSRPETDAMANQMSSLVSSGPIYHNLDVISEM